MRAISQETPGRNVIISGTHLLGRRDEMFIKQNWSEVKEQFHCEEKVTSPAIIKCHKSGAEEETVTKVPTI